MKPILVLRHIHFEGLGYIEDVLAAHQVPFRLIDPAKGDPVPSGLGDFAGLILMGGPMSANDPSLWLEEEFALVRKADAAGMPVLGHCLGAQIISKALGGTVEKNPVKEIGWFNVTPAGTGASKTLFGDVEVFGAFHWHGETFSIPDGAELILKSAHCQNQGFVKGNIFAFQCHMEITADMLPVWTEAYRAEIRHATLSVQSEAEMLREAAARAAKMQAVARPVYENWIGRLER